jgi:hypothetical protein
MDHTSGGTFGKCRRCTRYLKKKPVTRLFSLQFRRKQYWLCECCLVEINNFVSSVKKKKVMK